MHKEMNKGKVIEDNVTHKATRIYRDIQRYTERHKQTKLQYKHTRVFQIKFKNETPKTNDHNSKMMIIHLHNLNNSRPYMNIYLQMYVLHY